MERRNSDEEDSGEKYNSYMEEKPDNLTKTKRIFDEEIKKNMFLNETNDEDEPKEFLEYKKKPEANLLQMIPFLKEKPTEKDICLKMDEFVIMKNTKEKNELGSGENSYALIQTSLTTFSIIEEFLLWFVDIKYCQCLREAKVSSKYPKPLAELVLSSRQTFLESLLKETDFIFVSDSLVITHQPRTNTTSIKFFLNSKTVSDSDVVWILRKLERIKSLKRLLFNFKGAENISFVSLKNLCSCLEKNKNIESLWLDLSNIMLLTRAYKYIGKILNQNPNITNWALILDHCKTTFDQIEVMSRNFLDNIKVLKISMNENKYLSKEGQLNLIEKISKMRSLVCFELSIKRGYVFLSVFNYMVEVFRSMNTLTKFKVKIGVTYYKVLYLMFSQERRATLAAKCEMAELISTNARLRNYALCSAMALKHKMRALSFRKEIKNEIISDFMFEGFAHLLQNKEYRRRMSLNAGLKFLSNKDFF